MVKLHCSKLNHVLNTTSLNELAAIAYSEMMNIAFKKYEFINAYQVRNVVDLG
ncbi:hypothetical protein [Pseudoalteromonas sp. HM-SA03]|uniref:hypothetical protein n=1 Tax=Pseudoalteromonas sp. HM-SA03 TaxID=2029678 RepID=UPI0015951391|nr:hypothetical protein [Pseudoalteromonas sp. HM-SA03]